MITAIPEAEAANLLGCDLRTIRNAVKRDDLIRIPTTGIVQKVAKEQVMLFVGKTQVNKKLLTPEQKKEWEYYEREIQSLSLSNRGTKSEVPQGDPFSLVPDMMKLFKRVKQSPNDTPTHTVYS